MWNRAAISINHLFTLTCMSPLWLLWWRVCGAFSLSKLFWSKELFKTRQTRKPRQFSVYFGTRTRQTQVTFYLFSHSCPLLPLTSRAVKRNSLIISQYQSKLCVLQSVDIKDTHTLASIYNGVWPGLMLQQSDNEGAISDKSRMSNEASDMPDCDWSPGWSKYCRLAASPANVNTPDLKAVLKIF